MKLVATSHSDIKTIHNNLFNDQKEMYSMPLPGATCAIAGATCTCTSCCF